MTQEHQKKLELHDKEIIEIRTEFKSFKQNMNEKVDEILEKLKPQFTSAQITSFLFILVGIFGSIMIYATDVNSNTRNNKTKIEILEKDSQDLKNADEKRETEYDQIMIKLTAIQKDVEALNKQNRK